MRSRASAAPIPNRKASVNPPARNGSVFGKNGVFGVSALVTSRVLPSKTRRSVSSSFARLSSSA